MTVRVLTSADLESLMRLKQWAGWNQTREDLLRLLQLEPAGCFGIDVDGALVASATAISYGIDLAWIGMVLTAPEYRGRGLARRLMEHAIGYCRTRLIGLDASDMGKSLYTSLGFADVCPVERWLRDPSATRFDVRVQPLSIDLNLDRKVFGADRSRLLASLAGSGGASAGSSYALARPGSNAAYFGPCVCLDSADFESLLSWCVAQNAGHALMLDLFPHNDRARRAAESLGFRCVRRLTRMVMGSPADLQPDERIYAIAGFELG